MRRFIWPSIALALIILYPLVFTTPFQQRLGALILLYAIAASAWNIIGGYAGQRRQREMRIGPHRGIGAAAKEHDMADRNLSGITADDVPG